MSMTFLNQLGLAPALLIALAGALLSRGAGEHARRRLLLFFLGLEVGCLSALYLTLRLISEPYEQPFFQLSSLFAPALVGMSALILMNLKGLAEMSQLARVVAALLTIAMLVLHALLWNTRLGWEYLILPGALLLAAGWSLFNRYGWLATAVGLCSAGVLFLFNWMMAHPPDYAGDPFMRVVGMLLFVFLYVTPGLSVVASAALVTASLQTAQRQGNESGRMRLGRLGLAKLGLALALPVYLAYTIFWGSVWDHTSDGLFGVFVTQPSALVAIGAGMTMTLALRGRSRLAGILFTIALPILLSQSFEAGWRLSYHEITEKRAARIVRALERFHVREGYYPDSLDRLRPLDLLYLQQPVILAGEGWCYQGSGNAYHLAAFHREFFSSPVSLHSYAMAGELPVEALPCASRLAEMKEKYYSPMEDPAARQPPLPTPLPEIQVGLPKTPIQPVLDGAVALPGSWSPDSAYFLFGTQDDQLRLHFLRGDTGEVCTLGTQFSHVDGLWQRYAWLPGGRLLYVDPSGEAVVATPCQLEADPITDHLPDRFTQVAAYQPETGQVLLQSESAFWILDGHTLEARPVQEVAPNPYELHWDRCAWLPGGRQVVIARLNGRSGSQAGATLYFVEAETGQVQNSLPLEGDFGQSAPWVEGLGQNEALLHGQGKLLLADFSATPANLTDVSASIFGLEIRYPEEASAFGSHLSSSGEGYSLSIRLNHPHNQAAYLYDSDSGQIYRYDSTDHLLLLFPDGYLMEMPRQEIEPTYTDVYEVVRVEEPQRIQPRLVLTGHTPREDPHLSLAYLRQRSQLAVASAHGVSLVSLPDGEMQVYWTLTGEGFSPGLAAAPDGSALVAYKDLGGLYYLPVR